jgi:hypothetical protein
MAAQVTAVCPQCGNQVPWYTLNERTAVQKCRGWCRRCRLETAVLRVFVPAQAEQVVDMASRDTRELIDWLNGREDASTRRRRRLDD